MTIKTSNDKRGKLRFYEIIDTLLESHDSRGWWPHENKYEIMLGAVLVQRTKWENVEKALERLKKVSKIDPISILELDRCMLEEVIRPIGFYRQKADRLMSLSQLLVDEFNGDEKKLFCLETEDARNKLLSLKGIGPETADTMLLYAGGKPIFIVDGYSIRLLKRVMNYYTIPKEKTVRSMYVGPRVLTATLSKDIHSSVIEHCQMICKKRPLCKECIIKEHCKGNSL